MKEVEQGEEDLKPSIFEDFLFLRDHYGNLGLVATFSTHYAFFDALMLH